MLSDMSYISAKQHTIRFAAADWRIVYSNDPVAFKFMRQYFILIIILIIQIVWRLAQNSSHLIANFSIWWQKYGNCHLKVSIKHAHMNFDIGENYPGLVNTHTYTPTIGMLCMRQSADTVSENSSLSFLSAYSSISILFISFMNKLDHNN